MTQTDTAQAEWEHRRRLRKRIERGDNFIDLARETKLAPVELAHALWLAFKEIDQPSPKELHEEETRAKQLPDMPDDIYLIIRKLKRSPSALSRDDAVKLSKIDTMTFLSLRGVGRTMLQRAGSMMNDYGLAFKGQKPYPRYVIDRPDLNISDQPN